MEIEHLISERTLRTARELARRFPSIDLITICRAVEGTADAESAERCRDNLTARKRLCSLTSRAPRAPARPASASSASP